jgi:predicted Zn-dependent peptidase
VIDSQAQETIQLPNGVRVTSEPMAGVRSVSVGVVVDVGSKDEDPTEHGYSHLLEHMLFQGTDRRDAAAIAEMMEVGGGAIGAFTTRDYTVYHATVLDEYLPFALEALGDMLSNSVLPEDHLEQQRSVILNEIAGGDSPIDRVNNVLKTTLWQNHPLGYPVAGFENILNAATRNGLMEFLQAHYVGKRMIIAAAGNVDPANLAAQAQDSFWPVKSSGLESVVSPPTPQVGVVAAQQRDVQQVYFALAWPAPAYDAPERYAWHVFSSLYGGSPTSRLYRRLREERGMVYHIDSQYQAYGTAGALVVEGATRPQTLVPVLAGTLIELIGMGQEISTPDEHHRAAQSLISQHLVSGDSSYVRMSRLGLQQLYFHKALATSTIIEGLRQQTPEQVQGVASELLRIGVPTIALVGPVTEELLQQVESMMIEFGGKPDVIFDRDEAKAALRA